MDMELAIETQRLRLHRLVAGLLVIVGFLSFGPVSRGFSDWTSRFVGSILSRAEAAARFLVIAQARRIATRHGFDGDHGKLLLVFTHELGACGTNPSLSDLRGRLEALQAVLKDLSRHALRLLRRLEKQCRRAACAYRHLPRAEERFLASLQGWRMAAIRIERPPDIDLPASPPLTSLRFPGGRSEDDCAFHILR